VLKKVVLLAVPALLLTVSGAQADTFTFSYAGVSDPAVSGSGTFVTGPAYLDGWLPITSITGTSNDGAVTGLEISGGQNSDTPSGANGLGCCGFIYDNIFLPNSTNAGQFTNPGLLFDVAGGSPTNVYSVDNTLIAYNYNSSSEDERGGAPINFSVIEQTAAPEPSFYGAVGLCLSGLVLARVRRLRRR
jgi:hypothetical protein